MPQFVLAGGHVQRPVAALDAPVSTDRFGKLLDSHTKAADVVTDVAGRSAVGIARVQHGHADCLETCSLAAQR